MKKFNNNLLIHVRYWQLFTIVRLFPVEMTSKIFIVNDYTCIYNICNIFMYPYHYSSNFTAKKDILILFHKLIII